jgi:hypothetical protein
LTNSVPIHAVVRDTALVMAVRLIRVIRSSTRTPSRADETLIAVEQDSSTSTWDSAATVYG